MNEGDFETYDPHASYGYDSKRPRALGLSIQMRTPAMFDCDEDEAGETAKEHPLHCGCRHCDPDFYLDPAERLAGERSERW